MCDCDDHLEWNLEGTEDFTVRGSATGRVPAGVTIDSIDEIVLQYERGKDDWVNTSTVAATQSIVPDDFDEDNPVASAAIYWTAARDVDGDPVLGRSYRWLVRATMSNGLSFVAKPRVKLIP